MPSAAAVAIVARTRQQSCSHDSTLELVLQELPQQQQRQQPLHLSQQHASRSISYSLGSNTAAFGIKHHTPSSNAWFTRCRQQHQLPLAVISSSQPSEAPFAFVTAFTEWVQGKLAYTLQQLSTANVAQKIFVLMLSATPFIFAFGILYQRASGLGYWQSLYKVYALLYRVPGIGLANERSFEAALVANAVFMSGVFTFAIFLGIVSDEIKVGIKSARNGNYPVRCAGHVLLLNWNSQTTAILRQIAAAEASGRGGAAAWYDHQRVVILADKSKAEMDAVVHEVLRDRGYKLEVHTRQGNPYKLSDLRKVAASKAGTVILLQPDGANAASAEAIKASAAMCLTALGSEEQRVVVQVPAEVPAGADVLASLAATAKVAGRDFQVLELPDNLLMYRLVAQTAAQPGILTCWLDLLALARDSAQFRCTPVPEKLAGKTYAEIRRHYTNCIVCGYADDSVILNPKEDDVVQSGWNLVLLTRNCTSKCHTYGTTEVYETAAKSATERIKKETTYHSKVRQILVAGWQPAGVQNLVESFREFVPPGSTVTFITNEEPRPEWPSKQGTCRFNYITAEYPTSVKVLLEAGIRTADTVVLGEAPQGLSDMEADARVLSALLQVQDAVLSSKRRTAPHLVAPIKRYATSKLATQYLDTLMREHEGRAEAAAVLAGASPDAGKVKEVLPIIHKPEFLMPNDVLSAIMTQVVAEPTYPKVMSELLWSHRGQELYLRNPASFNIPIGTPITFAEVAETVRLTQQTAVGYIRRGGQGSAWGSSVLAPPPTHLITFQDNDRIVVLAEEYKF
eukprot:jgi/Chrzof1/9874/Cz04g19080.t1